MPKKGVSSPKLKKWTLPLNSAYSNYSWYQISGYFRLKMEKSNLCVRPWWSLLTILNFSARGPTANNILMFLLRLVAETKIKQKVKSSDFARAINCTQTYCVCACAHMWAPLSVGIVEIIILRMYSACFFTIPTASWKVPFALFSIGSSSEKTPQVAFRIMAKVKVCFGNLTF